MLHVHCGDSSAASLRQARVPGDVTVWSDLFTHGPVPADLPDEGLRVVRASALAESMGRAHSPAEVGAWLHTQDEHLATAAEYEEVVLWFDGCLYDQLILVRQLDWFARHQPAPRRLSLLCVGDYAGLPRYDGLGQLSPAQLAALLPRRAPVARAQTALARAAWRAFRRPDPGSVLEVLATDTSALPWLGAALRRWLEEFPGVGDGLGRLAREALAAVAAGHSHPAEVFRAVSDHEHPAWFGDTTLWYCLNILAHAPRPALAIAGSGRLPTWNPPRDLKPWSLALTPFGEDLLAGRGDWVAANGIDRWLGGAHLTTARHWRYDAGAGVLRPVPS